MTTSRTRSARHDRHHTDVAISSTSRLQTEDRIPARPEGRDSLRRTRDGFLRQCPDLEIAAVRARGSGADRRSGLSPQPRACRGVQSVHSILRPGRCSGSPTSCVSMPTVPPCATTAFLKPWSTRASPRCGCRRRPCPAARCRRRRRARTRRAPPPRSPGPTRQRQGRACGPVPSCRITPRRLRGTPAAACTFCLPVSPNAPIRATSKFLLVVTPLNVPGATGSPVNPVAAL